MPLPLIPILIAGGTALFGVVTGALGLNDMSKAKKITKEANDLIKKSKRQLNYSRTACNTALSNLGKEKITVLDNSIKRFVASFEKLTNYEFATSNGLDELSKFVIDKNDFKKLKDEASYASSIAGGLLGGSLGGALTAYGAYSAVGYLGATTLTGGTAISSLSGVAAHNATLAWLGGGALSAGGTGMAGGALVLGGLALGPALAVAGVFIVAKGSKALDEAKANMATAEKAAAELNTAKDLCNGIAERSRVFTKLLSKLDNIFKPLVTELEQIIEKSGTDYSKFCLQDKHAVAKAYAIAGAIKSVLDTPILSKDGKLTNESTAKVTEINTFISKL